MSKQDVALMAHLMRRAGFGASRDELDALCAKGYEHVVEELLRPSDRYTMPQDLVRRYHHDHSAEFEFHGTGASWLYRLVSTRAPLQEKIVLFWHGVFATAYSKVPIGKVLMDQIRMFRGHGMGGLRTLLVELSRDPAMVIWLDNQDNHNGSINENYGRELLELFSMGVGSYTEQDIKECARAFTGWTVANTEYTEVLARRNSIWPYGKLAWRFEYRPDDHDDGEKTFLGETGRFGGEDIIDIISRQPATASFIARHMYHFFVADEPPVPQWPHRPPGDPEAVEVLARAYFDSGYDVTSMLRVLFNSDFFRSEKSWYAKVKSPAELVAGVLRLTGEFQRPRREIMDRTLQMIYMGQALLNPPTVEGWHQGREWIDSGTLVERLNFATQQLGDGEQPGVRTMVERIASRGHEVATAEGLVDACLDELGAIRVSDDTRSALVDFANTSSESGAEVRGRAAQMLRVIGAAPEFQKV